MLGWQFSWQAEENPELEKINNGKNKNPSSDGLNSLLDPVLYNFSPKIVVSPLQSKNGRYARKKEVAVSRGPSKSTESHRSHVEALVSVMRMLQVYKIVVWLLV